MASRSKRNSEARMVNSACLPLIMVSKIGVPEPFRYTGRRIAIEDKLACPKV